MSLTFPPRSWYKSRDVPIVVKQYIQDFVDTSHSNGKNMLVRKSSSSRTILILVHKAGLQTVSARRVRPPSGIGLYSFSRTPPEPALFEWLSWCWIIYGYRRLLDMSFQRLCWDRDCGCDQGASHTLCSVIYGTTVTFAKVLPPRAPALMVFANIQ